MEIDSLHDLFVFQLQGAYHMERRLVDILDSMAENATNDRISTGFAKHRDETEVHVERVREAFDAMSVPPEERDCQLVEALDRERNTVEDSVRDRDLLNLFYLDAGVKTERIEIRTYESLLSMADRLELGDDVTDPLEANLDSEETTLRELQTLDTASDLKSLWERFLP